MGSFSGGVIAVVILSQPVATSTPVATLPPVATSTLAPVRVRGRAIFTDPTASSAQIEPEAIAEARRESATLGQLVDRQAGARVLDEGGPLHAERVTVRGGNAAQAQVLIDGVALASPFATGLDVGILSAELTSRATLVRGGAGAVYGDGALTGALAIETLAPRDTPPLALTLRAGSQDRFGISGAVRAGPIAFGGDVDRTSGRFDYLSRSEGLPDRARTRDNNDASLGRAFLRGSFDVAGGQLTTLAGAVVRERGSPGFESGDPDAREKRANAIARLAWRGEIADGATLEIAAQGSGLDIDYDDPDPLRPRASRTTFFAGGGESALALRLGDHRLRASVGGGIESSRSTEHGTIERGRGHVMLADELSIDDWRLFGAVRGAIAEDDAALLPRAGVVWSLTEDVSLTLALGRSFRAPAIDELYHPPTRGFSGNPSLRPETAWEGEIGLRLFGGVVAISTYARRIDDVIVYIHQNAFIVRPENLGAANAIGAELELSHSRSLSAWDLDLEIEGRLTASAHASELAISGAPIPLASPFGFDAEIEVERGALSMFTRVGYAAAATANVSGTFSIDPYARWDFGLVWLYAQRASLAIVVTNLLDDRTLETLFKIPLPGRSVLATFRVEAG